MRRSRISTKFKKKSQITLILSIAGIILVFILIFKFGIPFVVTVGSLFEKISNSTTKNNQGDFLATPRIDDLPNATNKKGLDVSGFSSPSVTVELYLSGELYDQTKTEENDGSFSFEVSLSEGDNIIKARARNDKNQSEFSSSQIVTYKNTPPSLTIDTPIDGSNTNSENVTVSGKTDEEVRVTVNDFWAVLNPDNSFSYILKLNPGENKITIVASDDAGNKTEKEIKVTYSP